MNLASLIGRPAGLVLLKAHLPPNTRFCPWGSCGQAPYRVSDIARNSVGRVENERDLGRAS